MSLYTPETVSCNGETFSIYLTQQELEERVAELGDELSSKYEGKNPIFIGVLNGAYIFLSDLMRQVDISCEVDFLKLSSYGDEKVSSGEVTDLKDIDADIEGRHVILVEDIVDTGLSMNYLVDKLQKKNPESIATVTLLHKTEATHHSPKEMDEQSEGAWRTRTERCVSWTRPGLCSPTSPRQSAVAASQ